MRAELEAQAAALGLGSNAIEFTGSVSDVALVFGKADISVLTSEYEGTPNVLLEAMACGLPVVATDVGGVPDVVRPGINGFLTRPGDDEGLLSALKRLINNPDLLIFDEPTSGLDPIGRMKVREIIQRLKNEGKTVFFSSHELGEVETVCDRVAIIHQGELKVQGSVAELVAKHQANLEKVFLDIIGYQSQLVS